MRAEGSSDVRGLVGLIAAAPERLKQGGSGARWAGCKLDSQASDRGLGEFLHSQESFPAAPHSQWLALRRAEALLRTGGTAEAARLLLTSQAITFRHRMLLQYSKRRTKAAKKAQSDAPGANEKDPEEQDENHLQARQVQAMAFRQWEEESGREEAERSVAAMLGDIPSTWTVVQISCVGRLRVSRFKETKKDLSSREGNPNLCLIRLRNNGDGAILRQAEGPTSRGVVPYRQELQSLLKDHSHIMKKPDNVGKTEYWELRQRYNSRLTTLVHSLERSWLGAARTLLLGQLVETAACDTVDTVQRELEERLGAAGCQLAGEGGPRLRLLLGALHTLTPSEVGEELRTIFPAAPEDQLVTVVRLLGGYAKDKLNFGSSDRHPVILILDPGIQDLPWESLPCLARQPMSRVPSLQFLRYLWETHSRVKSSVVQSGVATNNIFYVVNPDKSLPKTQERMDKVLKLYSEMKGVSGRLPQPGQLAEVLSEKDAFMYCGHGSGGAYISNDAIERLQVRAVPLLMGCSSGQLFRLGRGVDPLGTAQSYLLGGSPALLGFLWPVSDLDVDNWTVSFLEHWLSGQHPDLLLAAANMRASFNHFTNGAALVAYGLPVVTKS